MIRRLIIGFAVLAPALAVLLWKVSIPGAISILFVSHMLILYPTLAPNSRWLGPVATRFASQQREVWLTIDDGPDPIDTLEVLDALDEHHARATFFLKGQAVEKHPDLARTIVDRGHTLGNHSFRHPSGRFWCLSPIRIAEEIDLANDAIERATGVVTRLFRAPIGHKNLFVHPALATRGMTLVGWTARGWDTVSSPEAAAERIMATVTPGAIVLVHQGFGVSSDSAGLTCIRTVLARLSADGYRCVIPAPEQIM